MSIQLEGYEWLVIMIRLHEYPIESYERFVVKRDFTFCRSYDWHKVGFEGLVFAVFIFFWVTALDFKVD